MRLLLLFLPLYLSAFTFQEKQQIGERIWKNECNGTLSGLTSWNAHEPFPSLGIAHFIWFPAECKSPFQETFPSLIIFLQKNGVNVPKWLTKECPWSDREAFYRDIESAKMIELRQLLSTQIPIQTEFIIRRFEESMQKLLVFPQVKKQYERLIKYPEGVFAMIDYLNFKGDGLSEKERYQGVGWGLSQVLAGMEDQKNPLEDFVASAKRTLQKRVELSPPEKNEKRWLPGWMNRIDKIIIK